MDETRECQLISEFEHTPTLQIGMPMGDDHAGSPGIDETSNLVRHDFRKNSMLRKLKKSVDTPRSWRRYDPPAELLGHPAHSDKTEWKLKAWSSVRNFKIPSTVICQLPLAKAKGL